MKISLTVSDELFETYVKKFGLPAAYQRMRAAIEAYQGVDKDDRILLIAGDERRALEAVFQTTVESPLKLIKLCQNMNSVHLQGVSMNFSQDQLERLSAQAGFHGRTLEQFIIEQVDEIKATMLERV